MIKRVFIIATDDHGLQHVYGTPAVQRVVRLALQAGLKVHLISSSEAYFPVLQRNGADPVVFHTAPGRADVRDTVKEIGLSEDEDVLIIKANHVIDRKLFTFILEMAQKTDLYVFESEGHGQAQPVYAAPAEDVAAVVEHLYSGEHLPRQLTGKAKLIQNVKGIPYLMEKGDCRGRVAEEHLMRALASQTSQSDGFMSRCFDRYISRFISKLLLKTRLTPNMVTMIGVAIGFLSAYMFSLPGYVAALAGALLFVICIIFDGVDGEIARLKLKESRFGHYLDVVSDNIVHVAIFFGMAVGLYRQTGNVLYLHLFWVLIVGFACCAVSVYYCVLCKTEAELKMQPFLMRIMALLTNRDFAYIILLFAVFDKLNWFFIGSAFGTFAFALGLWLFSKFGGKTAGQDAVKG